jgi:hypothetical protein
MHKQLKLPAHVLFRKEVSLILFKNEITSLSTTRHGHRLTVAASLCDAPVARRATATGRQPGRMLGDGLPTGRYVTRASRLQLIVDQTLAAQIEDCFARARSSGRAGRRRAHEWKRKIISGLEKLTKYDAMHPKAQAALTELARQVRHPFDPTESE